MDSKSPDKVKALGIVLIRFMENGDLEISSDGTAEGLLVARRAVRLLKDDHDSVGVGDKHKHERN